MKIYSRIKTNSSAPKIFINSMPKAGTHLIKNIISSSPYIVDSFEHIYEVDIDKSNKKVISSKDFNFSEKKLIKKISSIQNGQIVTAHISYHPNIVKILNSYNFKIIYIKRDLRDQTLSNLFYIKNLKRHWLHKVFNEKFNSDEKKIKALINGFKFSETLQIDPLKLLSKNFKRWGVDRNVYSIEFEKISIDANKNTKVETLKKLFKFLNQSNNNKDIDLILKKFNKKKSPTLRKGKKGEGNIHFKKIFDKHKIK
mgnify:CR=1 FL=1